MGERINLIDETTRTTLFHLRHAPSVKHRILSLPTEIDEPSLFYGAHHTHGQSGGIKVRRPLLGSNQMNEGTASQGCQTILRSCPISLDLSTRPQTSNDLSNDLSKHLRMCTAVSPQTGHPEWEQVLQVTGLPEYGGCMF